ncbi:hypothetical protein CVT25_003276 [Psilocybe cyanescens]|uniref:Uncharacterized protein n=1 Tax=Psilocybe cyanescens TaxID=93625 RepID=A0A409WMI8_PSICY|nr:hypothetical protein CVT25_003276 [Psilocybe cyanescens]
MTGDVSVPRLGVAGSDIAPRSISMLSQLVASCAIVWVRVRVRRSSNAQSGEARGVASTSRRRQGRLPSASREGEGDGWNLKFIVTKVLSGFIHFSYSSISTPQHIDNCALSKKSKEPVVLSRSAG